MRQPKISQFQAHYRDANPDDMARCGTCVMYSNGSCTLVSGKIDPDYVCDWWELEEQDDA